MPLFCMHFLRRFLPLLPVVWLCSATCALAQEAAASDTDNEAMAAIPYYNSRGFMIVPPPGWVNDAELARHAGVYMFYIPAGTDFADAPGFIYPKVTEAQGQGEAAANAQAAWVIEHMSSNFPDANPELEKQPDGVTLGGVNFYVRRINHAPYDTWESVVYIEDDQVLCMLVLSCRSREIRDRFEPLLLNMARETMVLQIADEEADAPKNK